MTEDEAPSKARTGSTENKSAEEEENIEALLLVGDGGILAVPPSVQHSKHQRVVERETKEVLKMAIKAKANKLMKLVNIKGKTQMKSTISHHQEEHKLFILFLFKHDNHFLEE